MVTHFFPNVLLSDYGMNFIHTLQNNCASHVTPSVYLWYFLICSCNKLFLRIEIFLFIWSLSWMVLIYHNTLLSCLYCHILTHLKLWIAAAGDNSSGWKLKYRHIAHLFPCFLGHQMVPAFWQTVMTLVSVCLTCRLSFMKESLWGYQKWYTECNF